MLKTQNPKPKTSHYPPSPHSPYSPARDTPSNPADPYLIITPPEFFAASPRRFDRAAALRNLAQERILLSLLLALPLVLLLNYLRHDVFTGMPPDNFCAMKAHWRHCADIVLVGDSRVRDGLAPAALQPWFPDSRILNYAFGHVALNDAYLTAAENVLDPASPHKIIILGISPSALTHGSSLRNQYQGYMDKSRLEKAKIQYCGPLLHFFHRLPSREIRNLLRGEKQFRRQHRDGWMASHDQPEHLRAAFANYSTLYTDRRCGPVRPEIIAQLLAKVRSWHEKGIRVYALRLPTSSELIELEDRLSGYNEKSLIADFQRAGGAWIHIDQNAYHTYDGSHLHFEEALRFSRTLAQLLQPQPLATCNP